MESLQQFGAIIFAISVVIGLCNIILFLILVICLPMITGRIKHNTEVLEENTERIERVLKKLNSNIIKTNKIILHNNYDDREALEEFDLDS
ncbi:hypothetical protein [Clostridium sp.]|uniref:hypothetical protein n=1 Tax=Clostridium sp. TaxID=1506 RepID=UPI002FCA5BAD